MTSSDLTYQEAEAILQQLAGPSPWTGSKAAPLAAPPGKAQGERASGQIAPPGRRAAALRRTWSESTFRRLVEFAPDALLILDRAGTILLVNAHTEKLFGYRREELLGLGIEVLIPTLPDRWGQPHAWQNEVALELYGRRKDGGGFSVEVSISPLEGDEGPLISSTIRDISYRKRLEARYRNLVEGIPAVTFMAALDEGSNELYVSPQIEQLLGFSQKQWLEDPVLWYTRLHPEDRERWHVEFAQTCATAAPFRSVYRFIARDGRVVWVQGEARVVRDSGGRPLFLQGVAFDITERKNAEEALRAAHDELEDLVEQRTGELARANRELHGTLQEKESLLKEIHHRVKNNLQVICSLLNLQSASIQDPATLHAIRESQSRVRSMALIHEKLYQSRDLARIAFGPYVRELAAYLVRSYGASAPEIEVHIDIGDESLTIDTAIPCGLIITELVTNCLKHAFVDRRTGAVTISLGTDAAGAFSLTVRDNGIGLPAGLDPRRTQSLGLQLICTLAHQLHATLDIHGEAGTSFILGFREMPPR